MVMKAPLRVPPAVDTWLNRNAGALVFYYHGVARYVLDPTVESLQLPVEQFDRHVQTLRKRYDILSIDEFAELFKARRLRHSHALLTFDDGYRNNLTIAAPYLRSYKLPFTVFVSTEHLETGERLPGYYVRAAIWTMPGNRLSLPSVALDLDVSSTALRRAAIRIVGEKLRESSALPTKVLLGELRCHLPDARWAELDRLFSNDALMTWEEVRALRAYGGTIGSHCHSHTILHERETPEEIRRQLETSKRLIAENVGECRYFSYPHGHMQDVGPAAYRRAQGVYELAFTAAGGAVERDSDAHLLPRVGTPGEPEMADWVIRTIYRRRRSYRRWVKELRDSMGYNVPE